MPEYLAEAIEVIHAGMQEEQDPKHVQTLAQCLRALTGIQSAYMQQQGGGQQQMQQGGGARDALMAQLQGQV
jgi:hypothetical protein